MSFLRLVVAAVCMAAGTLSSSVAAAQVLITSPAPGQVFQAGPDFATQVHNDPWDFSNVEDLSPFPDEIGGWIISPAARATGRSTFLTPSGPTRWFTATTDTAAGNLVPLLFRGGAGLVNTGRTGAVDAFAIPTATYGKLAIKMRLGDDPLLVGLPNQLLAVWYHRPYGAAGELDNAGQVGFGIPTAGWVIYTLDLENRQWTAPDGTLRLDVNDVQSPLGGTPAAYRKSALARGFFIRATSQPGVNIPVDVDWVRLTARDGTAGASMMTINYTGCAGAYTLRIADADANFAVTNGAGAGGGSIAFNYGILAPGSYSMTLTCGGQTSPAVPFVVNTPPAVTVINPDEAGGADFATDVLSNPWDMADAADVRLTAGVTGASFISDAGAPAFQATGTFLGDPQVTLLNGGSNLISSRRVPAS